MFVPVPTPEEMARWDAGAIASGLAEETLMENAARAAMDALRRAVRERGLRLASCRVLLVAGKGNNGGDAFCMARHLLDAGAHPLILSTRCADDRHGAAGHWLDVALRLGVPFLPAEAWDKALSFAPDILVDALLGTGFRGELREKEKALVENMNALSARLVFAVDVPSGLDARTGLPCPDAVRAHVTATFQAAKPGLLMPWAAKFTGDMEVLPIGMPRAVEEARKAGFVTCAAQKVEESVNPLVEKLPLPALLVLGNEEKGVRPGVLKHCDCSLCIPFRRDFDSLNVAQAGAILISCFARSLEL